MNHQYAVVFTFQLAHGTNIASIKTPSNGPEVADVINIDDSMTPDKWATINAIPIMIKAQIDPINI